MNIKRMTTASYHTLYTTVFNPANKYPGYNPAIVESPDGNHFFDQGKSYAHIARKYLKDYTGPAANYMEIMLEDWTNYAREVAIQLGFPMKWWPNEEDSTLRLLCYPEGTGSAEHYDFDLFTLPCYRNLPENYSLVDPVEDRYSWINDGMLAEPNFHYGELAHAINPEFVPTKHKVSADAKGRTQFSAVFFAMPRLNLHLPNGIAVSEWLEDRKGRSRSAA